MTQPVISMMVAPGAAMFYSAEWRLVVETHLVILRSNPNPQALVIEPNIGYKFEGDFYGALTHYNIASEQHWVILRMNGMRSPQDFNGDAMQVLLPNADLLNQIVSLFRTTYKKIN